MSGFVVQQSDCCIYASRRYICVRWLCCGALLPVVGQAVRAFTRTPVVWFGPCHNPVREVDDVFPCLQEEADAQQGLVTCHSTLIGTSGPSPCSMCPPEIPT